MTAGRQVPESELVLVSIVAELREAIAMLVKIADGITRTLAAIDDQ